MTDVFLSHSIATVTGLGVEQGAPMTAQQTAESLREDAEMLLAEIAGPGARFRPGQWEAISELLARKRVLVVQRTGWGKSAVYLIATRLLRSLGLGPTVIISPLLALMRNQIEMADRAGVRAVTINSSNHDDWAAIEDSIAAGEVDLLLVSPERLSNPRFRAEVLPGLLARMGMLVVDEAHCISDWGHDFRPDYRLLSRLVAGLPIGTPVLGTTATANDRVVSDVAEQLGPQLTIQRGTLERESLALQVIRMPDRADRLAWLATTIPGLSGSGIVYCLTVRDAELVGSWLASRDISCAVYTGQSEEMERLEIERRLSSGDLRVVVATSALGMGYDNPFVEFVIHYQSPGSPIAYYQQVGRAGRAVDTSVGVLLAGLEDTEIQDYFITTAFPSIEQTTMMLDALAGGPRKTTDFERLVNLTRTRITAALKILEVDGAVVRAGNEWHLAEGWEYPAERVAAVEAERRAEQAAMRSYIDTDGCLMRFLRAALDDPAAGDCGRCSSCLGAPVLDPAVDPDTRAEALRLVRGNWVPIEPRRQWAAGATGPSLRTMGLEPGRAVCALGDPGLGDLVRRALREGAVFPDRLVDAVVALVEEWDPEPVPSWVAAIPRTASPDPVSDFARRLAGRLGLPFVEAVRRVVERPPQRRMNNTFQQTRNLAGAFEVVEPRDGPVLLFDDTVDSRWTLTFVGSMLRDAGVPAVHPVAIASTAL